MRTFKEIMAGGVRRMTWLHDSQYLRLRFLSMTGYRLDLRNPKTFQQKLQWLKLYNRRPEYTGMVDKVAVKSFVSEKIGEQYVIPTLGTWKHFDDIDFNSLPDRFVLKTSHGGGSTGVVICKDKSTFNIGKARARLEHSLDSDIFTYYREWPYSEVPRCILAEPLLEMPDAADLADYKIFCFNGEPRFIQVIQDRSTVETIDFFDTEWNLQPFVGLNPKVRNAKVAPDRPERLAEMIDVARKLAKDIPFVRVDLYVLPDRIMFGELTFYPGSGLGRFAPAYWDEKLGEMLQLPEKYND